MSEANISWMEVIGTSMIVPDKVKAGIRLPANTSLAPPGKDYGDFERGRAVSLPAEWMRQVRRPVNGRVLIEVSPLGYSATQP